MNEYQRTREARPELAPGDSAPHFRTTTLTGEDFGFENIAARETALIFLSPHCATCRGAVPGLVKLAKAARNKTDADIVLVSNGSPRESREWLESIEQSERIDVDLRVLVAKDDSDFQERYNPRGMSPYYCHVDSSGIVTATGGLHSPGWRTSLNGGCPIQAACEPRGDSGELVLTRRFIDLQRSLSSPSGPAASRLVDAEPWFLATRFLTRSIPRGLFTWKKCSLTLAL